MSRLSRLKLETLSAKASDGRVPQTTTAEVFPCPKGLSPGKTPEKTKTARSETPTAMAMMTNWSLDIALILHHLPQITLFAVNNFGAFRSIGSFKFVEAPGGRRDGDFVIEFKILRFNREVIITILATSSFNVHIQRQSRKRIVLLLAARFY